MVARVTCSDQEVLAGETHQLSTRTCTVYRGLSCRAASVVATSVTPAANTRDKASY